MNASITVSPALSLGPGIRVDAAGTVTPPDPAAVTMARGDITMATPAVTMATTNY